MRLTRREVISASPANGVCLLGKFSLAALEVALAAGCRGVVGLGGVAVEQAGEHLLELLDTPDAYRSLLAKAEGTEYNVVIGLEGSAYG